MIILLLIAAAMAIMGIVILIGKGDKLISGYNTASEEEREQYNIKRLRGLIGGLLIVLAPTVLMLKEETMTAVLSFVALTSVACIIVVILAIFGLLLHNVISLKMEQHELQVKKEQLEQKKKELQEEKKAVSDNDYIEEQARKQLKMIKPGEILYVLPDDDDKSNDPKKDGDSDSGSDQ